MTLQFKLSPRWLFNNAFELGGEISFGRPLAQNRAMLDSLLELHRKHDEAPCAPRTALLRIGA